MVVSIRDTNSSRSTPIGQYYISNPGFDPRVGSRGAVDSKGKFITTTRNAVRRGYMVTDVPDKNGKRYMLNFQYNPTSFAHSAALQADIPTLSPTGEDGGSNQGKDWMAFVANSGQSVDFSLLFDRTYETWYSTGGGSANRLGCAADIKVLYAMLGLYYTDSGGAGTSAGAGGGGAVEDVLDNVNFSPTGVLTSVPMWVYFGYYLQFYGIVQSINVTFTHFTQKMVPVRCAVNLSMSVLPRQKTADTVDTYVRSPEAYAKQRAQQEKRVEKVAGKI